jgi:hypothetical protein
MALSLLLGVAICSACSSPAESEVIQEVENLRPIVAQVAGATQVTAGLEYEYTAVGYDPDGDTIKYHFGTWPEGRYEEAYTSWGYTDFVSNNEPATMKITWKDTGTGYLCVHVVDNKGVDSQPHTIITVRVNQDDSPDD